MVNKIDAKAVCSRVDLVALVERYVKLRRAGTEFSGLCPFHAERTPSFTVIPAKGFVHCFGCGAHHDAIGFLMQISGVDFREAVRQLDGGIESSAAARIVPDPAELEPELKWVPLSPVPDDAPDVMSGPQWTVPIWNPKRSKATRLKVQRLDAYLDADGQLLGYVARSEIRDRDTGGARKWTPQITWCVSPRGARQWCLQHFAEPRPLQGLDALASKPAAPVLIVEGEKCRAAAANAWPALAVATWPGGTNGISRVDWTPLSGRDVVLWPDADEAGDRAMRGSRNDAGDFKPGIAHFLARVGARSIRMIDTRGRPRGWDIADALEVDGWTPAQAAAWARSRDFDINVIHG